MLRVIVVGALAYSIQFFMLRISGKRTLSKMNAFDLVIAVPLCGETSTLTLWKFDWSF